MTTIRIGMLLFPRLTQLDLTGPFEVFAKLPDATVLLLSKTLEPVKADTGLRMLPDTTLAIARRSMCSACREARACPR